MEEGKEGGYGEVCYIQEMCNCVKKSEGAKMALYKYDGERESDRFEFKKDPLAVEHASEERESHNEQGIK
jgi:hypothetical protein